MWRAVERDIEPLLEATQSAEATGEAVEFARTHWRSDCEKEALRKLAMCDGALCRARLRTFTKVCLRNARPSEQLCEDVPTDKAQALLWSLNRCAKLASEHKICEGILDERAAFCARDSTSQ